jgi:hypothetical protein
MSKKPTATKTAVPEQAEMAELDPMNALAKRIWNNQSVSLSPRERVERIKRGLLDQGFDDFSTLSLPIEGFERFL